MSYLLLPYTSLWDFYFYSSFLCWSTDVFILIYTHSLPHKIILLLLSEYWNRIHKFFKKQRPEPGTGSQVPPTLDYRYVLSPVCSVSPSITCPRGCSIAQAVHRVLSHTLNPCCPLCGWALPPQDYCLFIHLFINAWFRCQCTRRECLAMNRTLPEESSLGLNGLGLEKGSFRPVLKLTFSCLI